MEDEDPVQKKILKDNERSQNDTQESISLSNSYVCGTKEDEFQ